MTVTGTSPNPTMELMSRALRRRVISGQDAQTVGEVKALLLDRTGQRIEALHVAGRARNAETVAWQDIAAFGPDAVIIRPEAALQPAADEQQDDVIRHRVDILKGRVLGTDGFERGTVDDVVFDPTTGAVQSLTVHTPNNNMIQVPAASLVSLGSYCWVVDASVSFS